MYIFTYTDGSYTEGDTSTHAQGTDPRVSLYKILFHFKAFLWESMILSLLPSHLQTLPYYNTIASPLRNIRPSPHRPSFL